MLKKVLLLICLSVFVFNATKAQKDNDARKVLDKTAAIVGNKGGALANFKLSNGKLGAISGTISIKGNKFYARTSKATVWFNGKTQWSYLPSTNEVNVSNPNQLQPVYEQGGARLSSASCGRKRQQRHSRTLCLGRRYVQTQTGKDETWRRMDHHNDKQFPA